MKKRKEKEEEKEEKKRKKKKKTVSRVVSGISVMVYVHLILSRSSYDETDDESR